MTETEPKQGKRMTLRRSASLPKESMKLHLQDYCSSTSIHALKYVAEPKRPIIEKFVIVKFIQGILLVAWWLVILVVCFVCNVMLIRKMWVKFNQSPPDDYAVFEIPFPAITICNEIKIKKSLYDALKDTEEGQKKLLNLKHIERYSDMTASGDVLNLSSIFDDSFNPGKGQRKLIRVGEFTYKSSNVSGDASRNGTEFLIEATPSLSEVLGKCENIFTMADQNCTEWFDTVITDLGVCYSINAWPPLDLYRDYPFHLDALDPFSIYGAKMDWVPEKGIFDLGENFLEPYTLPYRALSSGRLFGFSFELKTNLSEIWEHRNNEENSGFKVQLHRPEDFPLMKEPAVFVPLYREVVVMVKPVINTISEGLKDYKPKDRKCYAAGEKWLSFFKVYTQKNCEVECLTNFTYHICNCVAVHMPRNSSMTVCSPSFRDCVLKAEIDIMIHWKYPDCKCWPSCFSLVYKSSTQTSIYVSNSSRNLDMDGIATSKLVVFFEDDKFPDNQRREVVDLVDFLSNCGGLLGLFSGMSLLSFCEIFYYLTLRLWNNVRLVRERVIFRPSAAPLDLNQVETVELRN